MKTWLLGSLLAGAAATAQTMPPGPALRDPMQPPFARRSAPAASAATATPAAPAVRHLYAVGDQRWVIQGGRKHGVGDLLGGARIERIEDSAVFVREGGSVRRLPLFAGVTKQTTGAAGGPAAASAAAPSTRTALAAPGGADRPPR
jgi:hypothetical protein